MKSTNQILIIGALILCFAPVYAQKKVDVKFEEIKEKCKGLPIEKRITITVARFNVTTPNTGGEFGENMATMLSNALQEVNCYRVLSSLKNKSDLNEEIEYGGGEYASKKAAVKKGNQLSAQLVVAGEVTEFNKSTSTMGVAIVKTRKEVVKLGFIIQLKNPETREIIASRSINVEGKSGGGTDIGIGLPLVGKLNLAGGSQNSPAVANALEQGIIKAVEAIDLMKTEYNIVPLAMAVSANSTSITISNASYETLTEFDAILKGIQKVKSTDPALNDNVVVIAVEHEGNTGELLAEIKKKSGVKYKVTGLKEGEIKLAGN